MNSAQISKILIVVESIDVEASSGAKGRVALIKNLHKAGFNLLVYHYTRKEIELNNIPCLAIREKRRSFLFLLSRMERHLRCKLNLDLHKPLENIFGFSFTLFNDRDSILEALKKVDDFKPDLVLTLSQGGSFRPHHALLKLPKWHSRWMAYIHDPYPMHSYPRPYDYVEPGHHQKKKFIMQLSKKAKYVAYPSKLLAEWMESYFSPLKGKAVIIPHQISDRKIKEDTLPEFFDKGKFNVVHAGTLLRARKPYALIDAFRLFLKKFPEAKEKSQLLFLGDNSNFEEYFEKVKKELPQLYYSEGNLPFPVVLAIQSQAAVNVILEAKGPVSPFLPGKFPHCVQAGKPILLLGPYYSETRRLLGEEYPYWAEIDNVDKISILIEELYSKWSTETVVDIEWSNLINYCSAEKLKTIINSI